MKRRNPPITLSTLPARTIYHAVLQFTQHHPRPHTKGRKPLYPEALILTLALLRTARRASYRQLLFCLAQKLCLTSLCLLWAPCCTACRPSLTSVGTRC
jgi:hypothetical protein